MKIALSETLRRLRRRDGRTQEALANAIGVTAQAVSRWESGSGYPDLETIPAIADYFHVTIDELFGYDGDRERKIRAILEEADREIRRATGLEAYLPTLTAAAEEYPSNRLIQLRLGIVHMMLGFERHGARSSKPLPGTDGENMTVYNRQNPDFTAALTIFEQILPELTEPEDRETVIGHMVRLYAIRGEYAKGEDLARSRDPMAICREILLPTTATGEQRRIYQGEQLLTLMWRLANGVMGQVTVRHDLRGTRRGIEMLLAVAALYQGMIDDGNLGFGHYALMELYRVCARTAAEQGLTEEAEIYAQKRAEHCRAYQALKERGGVFCYTAPAVAGVCADVDAMPPTAGSAR